MAAHVPAWKRIGLKLKNANDSATSANVASQPQVNGTSSHSISSARDDRQGHNPKRQKLDHDGSKQTLTGSQANGHDSTPARVSSNTVSARTKKRKSVSFTTETKHEDGDTRTTIDFPAGSPGSTPMRASRLDVEDASDQSSPLRKQITVLNEIADVQAADLLSKVPKRVKVKGTSKKSRRVSSGIKNEAAIEYLQQHHVDRVSWKFNKNRDTWLLMHALNVESLAPEHNDALGGYLRGLPENAGARTRLIAQARNVLNAEGEQNENRTARAELVLDALGASVESRNSVHALPARRKKSRTVGPVDLSSSESESDSDTTSNAASDSDEETSSSGSTSGSDSIDSD